jgi:hypothetical protein
MLARKRLKKTDITHRPHRHLLKTQTQKHATGKTKGHNKENKTNPKPHHAKLTPPPEEPELY